MIEARQIAVAIGHHNMPGAAALNLALLRKHNGPDFPILVTDDDSRPECVARLQQECERHNADLRLSARRLGHVGGDLRAFYHGLLFAQQKGCRYLLKLSQRAIFDHPGWLVREARKMATFGLPASGVRAGISPGRAVAHLRTSAIMLDVEAWARPDILGQLEPRELIGVACEWIVGRCLQELGGQYLRLGGVSDILTESFPGECWHDDPTSEARYRELADREGIELGPEFHIGGSGVMPDGSPNLNYR